MASGDRQNTGPSVGEESQSRSSPLKKPAGRKGKAGSSKKMTQEEQSERFIETARELGADETGKDFDREIEKILNK